ncbi:MAG: ATP-dependent DNA helicase RecG [Campylobacter sp.]|nr:ATP-dependent DNA helicase RecG [Campylobacter sp.]
MVFASKDRAELAKCGIVSLLDLALIVPKSFDDLSIKDEPNEGENVVEIECRFHHRKGSILFITAFCHTWECDVKIVIFNAKAWHFGAFKSGKKMFIHGKSSYAFGLWQFSNPKIITKTGGITPHYKSLLKDGVVQNFIEKYVSFNALLQSGLNENEANFLMQIHENSAKSVEIIRNLEQNEANLQILKFIEIYNYIEKLSHKKLNFKARKFPIGDISQWLSTLPFTPTNDQLNAINDIRSDLESEFAARRVVMGDVGSGKTLVILAAALMNYPQISYLMAPTTILCEQIYAEALRLLPKGMRVLLVKSGDKKINFDEYDFVIGTHALLFQDLKPSNLIMVDEQHRFGSNQREKINRLTTDGEFKAHFLQFSATPIPRTLSMIQSELVKFSFLKQMPFKKEIHTQILQNSGFADFMSHLKNEISKGNQAIIVYPLIEESEKLVYQSLEEAEPFWKERFERVFVTHGKDKEKEEVLRQFRDNGELLLTTTVVEVGISLPRLSTILIVGAERLGLASLHQLRGRVGRNGGTGFCYLYTKLKNPPERLFEFARTLDGFKVAEIDLKNRQGGDLLEGSIQHGATFLWYDYEENLTELAKERVSFKNKSA